MYGELYVLLLSECAVSTLQGVVIANKAFVHLCVFSLDFCMLVLLWVYQIVVRCCWMDVRDAFLIWKISLKMQQFPLIFLN